MSNIRIETDLLGSKEIDNSCYYGIHTLRAIENFEISNSKISDFPEFIHGMVKIKKAAALANKELGVIDPVIADVIVKACDKILTQDSFIKQFPIDSIQGGAGTSLNMNTNEVIANVALEILNKPKGSYNIINPNDHVNESQSTNDAYPSGFKVAAYQYIQKLSLQINSLGNSFKDKSQEFRNVLKMGRTQLQDAVPMSLGDEFEAFAYWMFTESKDILNSANVLLELNLGGTAIGTGVNTPLGYSESIIKHLSSITKLQYKSSPNLIAATSDCGDYIHVHNSIKKTALKLSKICNDLRLLSSGPKTGICEIKLPELQAGSSIMPAKINPVIPEVVNQACFKIIGNDTTISFAAEAGQLQLNVMEPVIFYSFLESAHLLLNACKTLEEKCIKGIKANQQRCFDFVQNSIGIITYFNPYIGHYEGDMVGKICAQTGKSVKEVLLERKLLSAEQIDEILSANNLLHPKPTPKKF